MRILVVNAGSSSVKLSLLGEGDAPLEGRELASPRSEVAAPELRELVRGLGPIDAIGHRIVHGGRRFLGPVRIDGEVIAALRELADLAPLHQAKSIAALDAIDGALPDVPAVACFDTSFHAELPAAAATYALPARWRERFGLRRYGFHGLSHSYASRRSAAILRREPRELRVVSCHLGAGASLAAVHGGRSVDTTMGFTPLEGLVMATRSGTVDPGLVLWLLEHAGISERELAEALEHESGMAALAGTADMESIVSTAQAGGERAQAALDVYRHRLRAGIAAMTAAMDGMDALVFTGGVGQNSTAIREDAVRGLGFLGVAIDRERNRSASGDRDVSAPDAPVRTLVVEAREDLEIARQVREVLHRAQRPRVRPPR